MPLSSWIHPKSKTERLYLKSETLESLGVTNHDDSKVWFEESLGGAATIHFRGSAFAHQDTQDDIAASITKFLHSTDTDSWQSLKQLLSTPMPQADRGGEAGLLDLTTIKLKHRLKIIVSTKEYKLIPQLLSKHPMITVSRADLPVGDYEVVDGQGNKLIVLRKRCDGKSDATDFEVSIQSTGQVFDESEKLSFWQSETDRGCPVTPVIILEGDVHRNSRHLLVQQVDGAISFLAAGQRISIIPTYHATHSANVIARLAATFVGRPLQRKPGSEKKPDNLSAQRRYMMQSLPGISTITAGALLETFGTIEAIVKAPESELKGVKGVGPMRARIIKRVLCGEL